MSGGDAAPETRPVGTAGEAEAEEGALSLPDSSSLGSRLLLRLLCRLRLAGTVPLPIRKLLVGGLIGGGIRGVGGLTGTAVRRDGARVAGEALREVGALEVEGGWARESELDRDPEVLSSRTALRKGERVERIERMSVFYLNVNPPPPSSRTKEE